ncbi:P-loop NTPase fold protein [Streptomyces sp. NPDC088760]|uniref:P-loop NTPase fold protein n=1 Tax=Streptomyces sp. NPDC088760 TaxID=3365890 RepID=UPI003821FAB3
MLTRSRSHRVGGETEPASHSHKEQDLLDNAVFLATQSSDLKTRVKAHPEIEDELRQRVPRLHEYPQYQEWKRAAEELFKINSVSLYKLFSNLARVASFAAFGFAVFMLVGNLPTIASLGFFFGLSLVATDWFISNRWRLLKRLAANSYMDAEANLSQSVNTYVEGTLSEIANRYSVVDEDKYPSLDNSKAPRLVELEADEHIESQSIKQIADFIREHKSSAIGLSGPRGVGKTTVMKEACKLSPSMSEESPEGYLGVYLPIPVKYTTVDFIRHLHCVLARTMIGDSQVKPSALKVRKPATVIVRALIGGVIASVGALIVFLNHAQHRLVVSGTDVFGIVLALVGTLVYIMSVFSSTSRPRASGDGSVEANLGREALDGLSFNRKERRSSKNVFKSTFMWVEDQDQVEITERERSHPESVDAFKTFAKRYCNETRKSVIIAIDELDKLDQVDEALEFINGIKDLLHVEGVHFIVSVSDDALYRFELRGVPLRDAFDSSFDMIIPVRRFEVSESRELIERRTVDFPDELTLYCHSLSGGLPRDLIRSARQCINVRRTAIDSVPIPEVVYRVTQQRALSVAEAALAKVREVDRGALTVCLEVISGIEAAEDGRRLAEVAESGAEKFMTEGDPTLDVQNSCAAFLLCLATSCNWFSQDQTVQEWRRQETARRSEVLASEIAKAVAALNIDPAESRRIVHKVRSDLKLQEVA